MTKPIDWSAFDAANGQLAVSQLEATSPAHLEAIKTLLKQGATDAAIVTRFTESFPTWVGHQNFINLAVKYLRNGTE